MSDSSSILTAEEQAALEERIDYLTNGGFAADALARFDENIKAANAAPPPPPAAAPAPAAGEKPAAPAPWTPWSGGDPSREELTRLSMAQRELVDQVDKGGPMTVEERVALKEKWARLAAENDARHAAAAKQAAFDADPQAQADEMARRQLQEISQKANTLSGAQLVQLAHSHGFLDADPAALRRGGVLSAGAIAKLEAAKGHLHRVGSSWGTPTVTIAGQGFAYVVHEEDVARAEASNFS